MKFSFAVLLISAIVLTTSSAPVEDEEHIRVERSFKQLPAGLLEPLLPLVKAIVPEPLLGKITMLLPLPAAMDPAPENSS